MKAFLTLRKGNLAERRLALNKQLYKLEMALYNMKKEDDRFQILRALAECLLCEEPKNLCVK